MGIERTDRRQLWWWLVLAAAAVALLSVMASALGARARWLTQAMPYLELGASAVVLACIAAMALPTLMRRSRGRHRGIDLWFAAVVLSWLLLVLSCVWGEIAAQPRLALHLSYQALQMALVLGAGFLLMVIDGSRYKGFVLLLLQWLAGAGLLAWHFLQDAASPVIWWWQVVNVCLMSAFFLWLGRGLSARPGLKLWPVRAVIMVVLGIGLHEIVFADGQGIQLHLMHGVYAGMLLALWQMLAERAGASDAASPHSQLAQAFAHSALHGPAVELQDGHQQAAQNERRRIAQELHDGVGSQLVGILASLDRRDPREHHLVASLEQCLLDVKILVDAIDDADDDLHDVLGRLRYRVQPSLDRLGIRLHWSVSYQGELAQVRGERARQVLRVVQEALANAMQHAGASNMWLDCSLDATGTELRVVIRDDGQGCSPGRQGQGKGIEGMRRRASAVGGALQIESQPGRGCRVLLKVPMPKPATAQD